MAAPVNFSSVNPNVLPRVISEPIFNRVLETSAVMRLARRVPLALTGNTMIPVAMDVPTADWVSEGGRKAVSSGAVGVKQMVGKKVAVIVPVSEEIYRTNAGGLYDQLVQDLPVAIARAFDAAAIHGKKITDGTAGPFVDSLSETAHAVSLGTASQGTGGVYADLVNAEKLVTDAGWDFTGWAADPRIKPTLKLATDTVGRPLYVDDPISAVSENGFSVNNPGNLSGYPAFFNKGVSGKVNRQSNSTDHGIRAIGGDWMQAAYGVGFDIEMRESREASYVDADGVTHSAFQENLVLLLAEAYYGFVIGDTNAFVRVTTTPVGS